MMMSLTHSVYYYIFSASKSTVVTEMKNTISSQFLCNWWQGMDCVYVCVEYVVCVCMCVHVKVSEYVHVYLYVK